MIVTPDQRLRVFVSSTLGELADERAAVREAVTALRLSPILFELGARPHPPRDLYRAYVEQSHIFLGIYWQSYGWVAPDMEISGIEDEYVLAKQLPRLIYVRRPAPDREPRLEALLARIRRDDVCYKPFSSVEELRDLVAQDVAVLLTERFQAAATSPESTGRPDASVDPRGVTPRPAALPSGDVTFLVTDVEGSTVVWEEHPEEMRTALADHTDALRRAVVRSGGVVVKDTGDGILAAFADATAAVSAAVEAQRMLRDVAWGAIGPLRVRMGLHSDEIEPVDGDYHGPAVNRCARIMAVAHGGQVLASSGTRRRAGSDGAAQTSFMDLGHHRLKDLSAAVHLYQVLHPDLPAEFPPLRSLDSLANNLPAELSTFVGREVDVRKLREALDGARLLTLVGTGGVGKTRLALQLAADQADRFDEGVWLVDLAALNDPTLVAPEMASVLRIGEQPGRTWADSVLWYLRERELLLVLDNCEHLLDEVASIVEAVLRSCPRVHLVATSREALGVAGEVIWQVPPLSVSAEQGPSDAERLFIERAMKSDSDFRLEDTDAATIAHICRRLDGIPLAIELAAARVKVLSVAEIADRLDHRFRLLTGGSRTALPRQRTLEGAVAWSYELLDATERRLFDRLSVFAGSFSLDAVEHVCADDFVTADDLLDLVGALADRSMLVHERVGASSSYRLLESMRAYGRDRLIERDELSALRDRHLAWANTFARSIASELQGPDEGRAFARVDSTLDDIRLALSWALEGDRANLGLECATSLFMYWYSRGVREGRQWLDRLLATAPDSAPETLAGALLADGTLAHVMGEHDTASTTLERSLALHREIGSQQGEAHALLQLGRTDWALREPNQVKTRFEESLRIFRRLDDPVGTALALLFIGRWEEMYGTIPAAAEIANEQEAICRRAGMPFLVAHAAEFAAAVRWKSAGEPREVRPLLRESLELFRQLGSVLCVAHCLETTAAWALEVGAIDAAARLLGTTEALREDAGTPVPPYENAFYEEVRERVSSSLGGERCAAELRRGRSLNLVEGINAAIACVDASA